MSKGDIAFGCIIVIIILISFFNIVYNIGYCVGSSDCPDCPPCHEEPDWDSMPEEWGYEVG